MLTVLAADATGRLVLTIYRQGRHQRTHDNKWGRLRFLFPLVPCKV